ncbi:type VI secretion system baseplate subunit TssF [soil metagenome]
MRDDLLAYYNGELAFLRELGAEFAARYPRVAGRLQLEAGKCEDPHVERLLEGVALLTARVRQKLDDEFPEITEALLEVLNPQDLRPLPSMAIAQFSPGPDASKLAGGYTVPSGTKLTSEPVEGAPCRFRTTYPTTLWPLTIAEARLHPDRVVVSGKPSGAVALLRLELRASPGTEVAASGVDRLRFYLNGDSPTVHALYEMLLCRVCQVQARGRRPGGEEESLILGPEPIRPVGFAQDEGMVPYPARSFPGYRLLQEYFAFPEKFLFFDLVGLDRLAGREWVGPVEILIFLDGVPRADLNVNAANFRLGCAPIVNLFPLTAEPISLDQARYEYRLVPDINRPLATEIYAIESVSSTSSFLGEPEPIEPFYALRRDDNGPGRSRLYWVAHRRPSRRRNDEGLEVDISFVDPEFTPKRPADKTITVRSLCTNRDLPARLPFGGDQGNLQMEAPGPIGRVRCLSKPSPSLRPPLGRQAHWQLISHLSLNHLSIVDEEEGAEALRTILRLYDWADSAVTRQQIAGITRVSSRRVAARTGRTIGNAACLGIEVELEFDESHFVGSGALLFAGVLERFFGMYASINSFTRLVARSRQREGILKRWPPRGGERSPL